MPSPKKGEKRSDFISRAIPYLEKEGYHGDQAIAIAYSMWKRRHKKEGKH